MFRFVFVICIAFTFPKAFTQTPEVPVNSVTGYICPLDQIGGTRMLWQLEWQFPEPLETSNVQVRLQLNERNDLGFKDGSWALAYSTAHIFLPESGFSGRTFFVGNDAAALDIFPTWFGSEPLSIDTLRLQFFSLKDLTGTPEFSFTWELVTFNDENEPQVFADGELTLVHECLSQGTLIAPHLTSPTGGFSTDVILANTGGENREVVSYGMSQEIGNFAGSLSIGLAPSETKVLSAGELFPAGSHALFHVDPDVGLTLVYTANRDDAGPAHILPQQDLAKRWRIYAGNPAVTWDGIAVVATESETRVEVRGFDLNGQTLGTHLMSEDQFRLSKSLLVLSDLFEGEIAFFEITATELVSLVSLRGTLDSRYLWANRALVLD